MKSLHVVKVELRRGPGAYTEDYYDFHTSDEEDSEADVLDEDDEDVLEDSEVK